MAKLVSFHGGGIVNACLGRRHWSRIFLLHASRSIIHFSFSHKAVWNFRRVSVLMWRIAYLFESSKYIHIPSVHRTSPSMYAVHTYIIPASRGRTGKKLLGLRPARLLGKFPQLSSRYYSSRVPAVSQITELFCFTGISIPSFLFS